MIKPIYKETPIGVIDWINKVFTVSEVIDVIDDVYLWWAPYRSVSFNWKTITFAEAPPLWADITIDYFYEDWTQSVFSDVTFWDIIDEVYFYIWQNKTSRTYLIDNVKREINKVVKKLNNKTAISSVIRQYSFNPTKALTAKVDDNWVFIWENISYIQENWIALLWDMLYKYNYYTAWVLWWTKDATFKEWDILNMWYKIPSSALKVSEIYIDWTKVEYVDNRIFNNFWNNYTIINYEWSRYLFLPYGNYSVVTVKYLPTTSLLINDSDIINFPYEYSDVISLSVAGLLYANREDDRYNNIKLEHKERKREWLSYQLRTVANWTITIESNILTNF